MAVRVIENDEHFQHELAAAAEHLVVADFTANWCGPCKRMAPYFEMLSSEHPKIVFLKVDVDKCQETAIDQDVKAMPTFNFYRNQTKIDFLQGADFIALEAKIKKHKDVIEGPPTYQDYTQDLIELNNFIIKKDCECLNESDEHVMINTLNLTDDRFLQSDCDEQLIMSFTFHQLMEIHALRIKAPAELGPKEIRIFINVFRTIDFDMAESMNCVQELSLKQEDLEKGIPIDLDVVKFQNVKNIQIFVRNNQSGSILTQINYIGFIGTPVKATNSCCKRAAGKNQTGVNEN